MSLSNFSVLFLNKLSTAFKTLKFFFHIATTCTQCTAGNHCPEYSAAESPCTTGFYSAAGAASCTPYAAGFQCRDPANPVACASGEYSLGSATVCTACPAGKIIVISQNYNSFFISFKYLWYVLNIIKNV